MFEHWENFYLIVAIVFVGMLVVHFAVRWSAAIRSAALKQTVEIASLAFVAFVVFIFLRPVEQFIYFQF